MPCTKIDGCFRDRAKAFIYGFCCLLAMSKAANKERRGDFVKDTLFTALPEAAGLTGGAHRPIVNQNEPMFAEKNIHIVVTEIRAY